MNKSIVLALSVILVQFGFPQVTTAADTRPVAPPLAIGLNGVASYGESWQFTDMMKHSREWLSRKDQKAWTVVEDENGWPVSLSNSDGSSSDITPENSVFMYFYGRRVVGDVTLTWEGDGEVAVIGKNLKEILPANPTPNRKVYAWDFHNENPTINVIRSNPKDHVRNIRLWMPGFADGKTTFHPEWTALLKPFPYLRFMDWNAVNGSKIAEWNERTKVEYMRQTRNGVAWEYVIQLANETGKDAWICIPHLASDDYVHQLARLIKDRLRPDLRVYVEYSNEIWNPSFSQTGWLYKQARSEVEAKGITDKEGKPMKEWEYAPTLCGRRSAQIWKIMADELGNPNRMIRVITHFRWLERAMAAALDPANGEGRVDLIGLNGYFISQHAFDYCQRDATSWNLDEAFDVLSQFILLEDAPAWLEETKKIKAQWPSIPITCYEGGQHFANPFAANSQGGDIVKLMMEVNGDRRIRSLYAIALESWYLSGRDGFTAFVDVGSWSKYGCWGHKEYVSQPLDDARDADGKITERGAHKWVALLDYAARSTQRNPAACLKITTNELPEAIPGQTYSVKLAAEGGTAPYKWSLLGGRLPRGLNLTTDGNISGKPTGSEQLAFMIDCTDSKGVPVAKPFALFQPPVAPAEWKPLTPDQLKPIHGFSGLPESAAASLAKGYAVQVTLTPKATPNPHVINGFAFNLNPDGDKDDYLRIGVRADNLIVCSRYVKDGKGELWGERRFAITPDAGEPDAKTAWDAGEAWTITATVRPGSGIGAIDLIIEVRDETGQPRLVAGRPDVAQGRALLRELALKDALRSGPWGLLAQNCDISNLKWAPLP